MPDNNPIYRGHLAKVNSLVPNEKRENTMNITIQSQSLGQYPVTIYGVYSNLLEGVEQGQSYNFTLARGNRKDQHKESAGEQDWMYFWNVASVAPAGATPPVQAEPENKPVQSAPSYNNVDTTWTPTAGDQWRADGQETGNARTNATSLVIAYYERNGEMPDDAWVADATNTVNKIAQAIRSNVNVEEIEPELDEPF